MKHSKILIIGAEGQLGSTFKRFPTSQKYEYLAPKENDCNLTNPDQLKKVFESHKPNIVINCAAFNAVDEAEINQDLAYLINAKAVNDLADLCNKFNCRLIHYSSDYVFDGRKQDLYIEEDQPNPLNVYGKSKLEGEQSVLSNNADFLVFRLSWVIGQGSQNFLFKLSNWANKNEILKISADEVSVPTFTNDIAELTINSLEKGLTGLYHMTSSSYASRYELARYYFEKIDRSITIIPAAMSAFQSKAERPLFSAMSNKRLSKLLNLSIPTWKESLDKFIAFQHRADEINHF